MVEYAFVNSALVKKENAVLPVNDLAFLRGYGVFDFFLVDDGKPRFFENHWQRLNHSANVLHLSVPFEKDELLDMLRVLHTKMPFPYAGARITLSGGNSPDGYAMGSKVNSVVTLQALAPLPDTLLQPGIKLMPYEYARPLATVKSIDYLIGIMMLPVAKQQGYDELLYVKDGFVTECPRSNVFAVTNGGVLVTPKAGVLFGITRGRILGHAQKIMTVEERPVQLTEMLDAQEVFISSTTKGIWPVGSINNHKIGSGNPGPVAGELYKMLLNDFND
ncbi:MAG: aminotransferase class IV [Chitinophagaceae bacterium]|nr:aminotransferase class IV [Chitinophagaceae bacterium]